MIITGTFLSEGGKEFIIYDEERQKYVISVADAKKTGLYKLCEDEDGLPYEAGVEESKNIAFLARKMSCVKYALYLIEFSDKSKRTLLTKLKTKGYEKEVCDAAMEVLESNNVVNDERLCAKKLQRIAETKFYGRYRIKNELIKAGFSVETVENAFENAEIDFDELIERLAQKIMRGKTINNAADYSKTVAKLQRYGYSYESIKNTLEKYKNFDEY
ncbi:MAG: recombination regulator RecX [Clostridiales bacterium]|nr:recombination regulator RecX [Clostridiales bacterium]